MHGEHIHQNNIYRTVFTARSDVLSIDGHTNTPHWTFVTNILHHKRIRKGFQLGRLGKIGLKERIRVNIQPSL
jgi:hypothetical protein